MNNTSFRIYLYNTYFRIDALNNYNLPSQLAEIIDYLTSYSLIWVHGQKRPKRVVDRRWLHYSKKTNQFYFPVSMLSMVAKVLRGHGYSITTDNFFVVRNTPIDIMRGKFRSDKFTLRDYQEAYQEAITNEDSPAFNLVDLKTGAGKTLISFYVMTKFGRRVGIVLPPKYIEKWIEDVAKYTNIKSDKIYVIQGHGSLEKLINAPSIDYDIIIFSLRTLSVYIKSWEMGEPTIDVPPYELFNKLRIGLLVSDESHQELGALAKVIMYSNVPKIVGLSATFLSMDNQVKKFQELLFPEKTRISNLVKFDNHIDGYICPYHIHNSIRIKYKRGSSYSHILFEQSIMSHKRLLASYIDMMDFYLKIGYLDRKSKGQKCLFFFSTIRMCTYVYKFFEQKYGKKLKVRRYVEDDKYEDMIEGDIIVSTVLSTGTAIDIPKLISVFHTVSIKSAVSNIQSAGRLRKIEGVKTEFYSIFCTDLESQRNLQKVRESVLKSQVRLWKHRPYPDTLPIGMFK